MRIRRQRQRDLFDISPRVAVIPADRRPALIDLMQALLSEATKPTANNKTTKEDAREPD